MPAAFNRRCRGGLAAALLLSLGSVRATRGETRIAAVDGMSGLDASLRRVGDLIHTRSASGCVTVIGTDSVQCYAVMRWAERTSEKLVRTLGVDLPYTRRSALVVALRDDDGEGHRAVLTPGSAVAARRRLAIYDADAVDMDLAREALCRLVAGELVRVRTAAPGEAGGAPPEAPAWLSRGLSLYLHSGRRPECRDRLMAQWQAGGGVGVADILAGAAADEDRLTPAVHAMFVDWLLSMPDRAVRMDALLSRLGARQPVDAAWLASIVPGIETASAVEERWAEWVAQRRYVIYEPGVITAQSAALLDSALLLVRGDSGIPLAETIANGALAWEELVDLRREPWIGDFALQKEADLRLLAVGRGPEFNAVIEAYAVFLKGLRRRASERRLRALLDRARAARARLGPAAGGEE